MLARVKFDTSADGLPPLGSGSTDNLLGLAYGYESRKWYRWVSARYRINGEYMERSELKGVSIPDSGGTEWFISPGIFWTLRNFAVKAGVQMPVAKYWKKISIRPMLRVWYALFVRIPLVVMLRSCREWMLIR